MESLERLHNDMSYKVGLWPYLMQDYIETKVRAINDYKDRKKHGAKKMLVNISKLVSSLVIELLHSIMKISGN